MSVKPSFMVKDRNTGEWRAPVIYCAGKVGDARRWREALLLDAEGIACDISNALARNDDYCTWPVTETVLNGIRYSGPFFTSCFHSDWHNVRLRNCGDDGGERSNHEFGGICIDGGESASHRDYIAWQCLKAIRSSDILFAWIDSDDAHGTLIELGYAVAFGLKVFVAFSNPDIENRAWFAAHCATESCVKASPYAGLRAMIRYLVDCGFMKRRVDYYAYIASPEWRARADAAKERAEWRCQVCYAKSGDVVLHAHHRTYDRLGYEDANDITVLCASCHKMYEDRKKIAKNGGAPR